MVRRKAIRTRGKFSFARYFQKLQEGDSVAIVKERSLKKNFPDRLQGRTGVVAGKRGSSYIVKVKDQSKEKEIIVQPIHLKKIKQVKNTQ